MVLASNPTTAMALRISCWTIASVALAGGVVESKNEVLPSVVVWIGPVPSEYCVMVLYSAEVPNWPKKLWMWVAVAASAPPAPQLGPQKIGTTRAEWITGPPWYVRFCPPAAPPGLAACSRWKRSWVGKWRGSGLFSSGLLAAAAAAAPANARAAANSGIFGI